MWYANSMSRLKVISAFIMLFLLACAHSLEAATGDGKVVYGNATAPTNAPKMCNYTIASGTWSAASNLSTASTTIDYVTVKASPAIDEYIAGVATSTNGLYIYTYSGGSWSQSWATTIPSGTLKGWDIEYEQNSGDAMVVMSNGATSNELAYRKRVDGVWDPGTTPLNSLRTAGAVEWVKMESRPNSDEIALAFVDTADDLNAFIWDGSAWTAEPTYVLYNNLVTTNSTKFDVAYEQNSGDCLIVSSMAGTTNAMYAVKLAGATTWTTGPVGGLLDIADFIDLGAEPSSTANPSNYIAFASIALTAADLQMAIWDGSVWGNKVNDRDTTCTATAGYQLVACGWAGTGTNRRAVVAYADSGNSRNINYFTWKKNTSTWEEGANAAATYSPPFANALRRNFKANQDPNFSTNGDLWFTLTGSGSDLWTVVYDGTSTAPAAWLTVDDGTAGNNAIETTVSTASYPCFDTALTSFSPTLVDLIGFKAETKDKEAVITWQTAGELRTAGFKIYRTFNPEDSKSYETLTPVPVNASGNPLSGRQYQYVDKNPLQGIQYVLEEVLKDGQTKRQAVVRLDDAASFIGGDDKNAGKPFLRRDGTIESGGRVISRRLKRPMYFSEITRGFASSLNPIKAEVSQEGLYRITGQDLRICGWDLEKITPNAVAVFNQGSSVPIYISGDKDAVFDTADYIEFYGQPGSSRYTTTNIYWIMSSSGAPERMGRIDFRKTGALTTYYQDTVRNYGNESYFPEFKGSSHWFFAQEFASPISYDFNFSLDHLAKPKDNAMLTVAFQGASKLGIGANYNRQRAIMYLNHALIGEAEWNQDEEFTFSHTVPLSVLLEGNNTLTIEAPDEGGDLLQYFLLNWFEVDYPRQLVAVQDKIAFDSNVSGNKLAGYKVRGFSSGEIEGIAVGPDGISRINDAQIKREAQGDYSFTFSDASPAGKRYVICCGDSITRPADMYPDTLSSLKSTNNQSDYIIIAHRNFLDGIKPLADLRQAQGLNVTVVDLQDIYDEFNNGIFSPQAIRDFLDYAYHYWRSPAPLFVLLVGDATFDYQDYWNIGIENLVPAYLVYSPDFGETVSDNWFVDFNADVRPEMFIGRLPVNTAAQLEAVVNKILNYEKTSPAVSWAKRLMFVADDTPEFQEVSDAMAGLVPGEYALDKLYLTGSTPSDIHAAIMDNLNQGRFIFNYTGHAGVALLSEANIFNNDDIAALSYNTAFPLFLTLNCLTGYFIYPEGMDGLSEVMLRNSDKGAVACITPSGLSSTPEQSVFMTGLYKDIFENGDCVLGAVHFKAKDYLHQLRSAVRSDVKADNVIQTYNLLGDPALILKKEGAPARYDRALLQSLRDMLK